MLIASVATLFFTIRYLLPAVPFIVAAGSLAIEDELALPRQPAALPANGAPVSGVDAQPRPNP